MLDGFLSACETSAGHANIVTFVPEYSDSWSIERFSVENTNLVTSPFAVTRTPHTNVLWRYYKALRCAILLEAKILFLIMVLPLLGRESNSEIYQVMKLPIP